VASGTGVIGFVSATGGVRWINQMIELPGIVAIFLFVLFLFVLLGWKLVWNRVRFDPGKARSSHLSDISWMSFFSLFIWIFLSLGVVWTGAVTGGVLVGMPDQLITSLFNVFFPGKIDSLIKSGDYFSASTLYWGVLILAFLTAYWTSGRKEDRWVLLSDIFPRLTGFLANGYGVDRAFRRLTEGIIWFGRSAENLIDENIWSVWIPQGFSRVIKDVSFVMSQVDKKISSSLDYIVRKIVEIPAKFFQKIQTGDLRWYLLFALGSGFALLSHFLK
jgi:hypothetical protein